MIRGSLKLLNELAELETQINWLEQHLSESCPEIDLEGLLQQILDKHKLGELKF